MGINIDALIPRVDNCFDAIRAAGNAALEKQAITYAAFLTDVQAGRISMDSQVGDMLDLIEKFCTLIETT